jgi:hypothetical protein
LIRSLVRSIRHFFYSDDEVVKLADGLSEFDAGSYEELLRNSGVVAMKKHMDAAYDRYWRPMLFNNFALFVKRSDVDRSIEILGSLLGDGKLAEDALEVHQQQRPGRRE